MKKNLLMLTCSIVVLSWANAHALTPEEQMRAMKEVFITSFNSMDDNKDGKLDEKEYLRHQFEKFRANIMGADSFDAPLNNDVIEVVPVKDKNVSKGNSLSSISDSVNIMQSMASYTLDDDYMNIDDEIDKDEVSKEDVMPQEMAVVSKEVSEDKEYIPALESLDFEEVNEELRIVPQTTKEDEKDKEIQEMISIIRKSLPKEIDEITKWVDIKYQNKMVTYVYKAEIDSASFSSDDMKLLQDSIKNDSCVKAYESMCPKIKPLFINEGINLSILYTDKKDKELSSCEFNKDTCI